MIIFQRIMRRAKIKIKSRFLNNYNVKIFDCLISKTESHYLIFKFVNVILQHRQFLNCCDHFQLLSDFQKSEKKLIKKNANRIFENLKRDKNNQYVRFFLLLLFRDFLFFCFQRNLFVAKLIKVRI